MPVRQPGNLVAGLEGVQEEVTGSVTITEGSTSGTVSLSLSGAYNAAPELVGATFALENPSAGSATTYVAGSDVDRENATTDNIDVTVHLDAAPGAGENVDVTISGWVSGDASK